MAARESAPGAWGTPEVSLLCGHLVPFSGTWPTSGSMRSGECFERPTREPRTDASECSSWLGGEGKRRELLPTPVALLWNEAESPEAWDARQERLDRWGSDPLVIAVKRLPGGS